MLKKEKTFTNNNPLNSDLYPTHFIQRPEDNNINHTPPVYRGSVKLGVIERRAFRNENEEEEFCNHGDPCNLNKKKVTKVLFNISIKG